MEKKIGFIGCGNMGKAILGGLIASGHAGRRLYPGRGCIPRFALEAPDRWQSD
ncbi:NAD(P)-binding domain-containing protein, partial [Escherichia coli]|nr:NAD(P)-binding domain-containing protein [Escherichia coli]